MGSKVELYPGALVGFYTVYECKKKQGSVVILKTNRGNFIDLTNAGEEKNRLDKAMEKSTVWEKDNDGRFTHISAPDVRWFYVKPRKFKIIK